MERSENLLITANQQSTGVYIEKTINIHRSIRHTAYLVVPRGQMGYVDSPLGDDRYLRVALVELLYERAWADRSVYPSSSDMGRLCGVFLTDRNSPYQPGGLTDKQAGIPNQDW